MKLYKEASLMMLPTSVKDGKLYSIFPQPKVISSELVTNGEFDTDSDWSKGTGCTISDGKAKFTSAASGQGFTQSNFLTIGKIYKVAFTVSDYSEGAVKVRYPFNMSNTITANGSYVEYGEATTDDLFFQNVGTSTLSIDNVSVVEVDQVPADFTFSRGSNLAATRINEQGLIEKGRENLLLHSNQFDTTWISNGITETSGQSGYDGSNDAWLIEKSNPGVRVEQSISGNGVTTFSVYLKAGTLNFGILNLSSFVQYFDLENGILGNESGYLPAKIDSGIESVGNGWYRCYITTNQSYTIARIYPARANGDNSGTSGSIYIQDAQLEVGLVATDYIESGATTGKAGVLEDLPRLNWGGNCPSLLLEPSRQNLFNHSEYSPALSTIGSPTFNANATISPEGYQNMAEYSSSAISDRYQQNLGVLTGQHTYSAFFKYSGTAKSVYIRMSDTASRLKISIESSGVTIDLTGTTNVDDSGVIDYGNGIYRVYMVFTPSTGTTFGQFYPSATNTAGSVYAYGFQIEQGSYPTSYIPTHGTSVTRSKDDIVEKADVGVTREDFTILFDIDLNNTVLSSNVRVLDLKDSSGVAQQEIRFFQFGGEHTFVPYFRQDSTYAFGTGDNDMRFDGRVIFRADGGGSYSMFFGFNGVSTKKVATGLTPYVLNKVSFLEEIITIGLKELTIWNTALSDNECINLTSI